MDFLSVISIVAISNSIFIFVIMDFLGKLFAFLQKDLKILFRDIFFFVFSLVFALVCTVLFSMILPRVSDNRFELLWLVFLFVSVFPPIDLMRYEKEIMGHLSMLRLGSVFFLSKFLLVLIIAWIFGFFVFFTFFFFLNFVPSLLMLLSFFISSFGICSLSILFSLSVIKGEFGFPVYIILFPLYIPVVISSVEFGYGNLSALKVLVGFDLINFSLSFALFDLGD